MANAVLLPRPRRSRQRRGLALIALVAAALSAPAAIVLWLTADRGETGPAPVPRVVFEETTGIRITRIAVVGGGGLVDVRFTVLDPDKAIAVHDPDSPLVLVNEENGDVVSAAFHGRHAGGTTQTGLDPAATYYLVFANSGRALQRGEEASVLLGDVRLEHVTVQ